MVSASKHKTFTTTVIVTSNLADQSECYVFRIINIMANKQHFKTLPCLFSALT